MCWKRWKQRGIALLLTGALALGTVPAALATDGVYPEGGLLTEPFLQVPGETSVHVVWFTEGTEAPSVNKVLLFENGAEEPATREIQAETTKMSRIRGGNTGSDCNDASIERDVWRHEAVITDLPEYHGAAEEKIPYQVVSDDAHSETYTLQAQAQPGTPMKILLTSDIQTKNMCAANIQKVYETVGPVDAILANGDIVDVADRAYDWFDADSSFFRVLQGTTDRTINGTEYAGAPLMQNAPTYAAVGNHEVMGRYSDTTRLDAQFNDPTTREYAEELYEQVNRDDDPSNDVSEADKEQFIEDNSFNTTSWEEVFTLPENDAGNERYYAVTIGDVRVIVLEVARIWRNNAVGSKSKYSEVPGASEDEYGFGQHIFEPIGAGSDQLAFLEEELQSEEFQNAKYKMVMYHWQFHSLGGNQIPAYTDPEASTVIDPETEEKMTIYEYPLAKDYLANYVEPLLEEYGVDFVFNAHSHLWNRFQTDSGMNILETSNNGNTYNAFLDTKSRTDAWPSVFNGGDRASLAENWDKDNYVLQGDPYGLSPIAPNLAELPNATEEPYLMSNSVTAFSILDTGTGTVDSYYFDTSDPDSEVVKFDSFPISRDGEDSLEESDVLTHLGSYSTGYSDQDGGVAEIVSYNADNEKFYVVNGKTKTLDIVSLAGLSANGTEQSLTLDKRVDVSEMIDGFAFGDITSVAVDTAHDRIAVAVQAEDYSTPGAILLLDYDGQYLAHYQAGVQPDMITFTPDGNKVLTADEGEPREGYESGTDPKGSVTIVDLSAAEPEPKTVTFDDWDARRSELVAANVLLKNDLNPSQDFEPEYIAVSSDGKTAYVALQEANAIATLDLENGTFTSIDSLGFKDHRLDGNEIDANKEDKEANLKWENLMGVYMPDGIAIYEKNGKTYLLTANEGDASEWEEYKNITTVQIGTVMDDGKEQAVEVEVLDKTKMEGLPTVPSQVNFILGGRSFSIYEVTDSGLRQVYDSGSDFETITAQAYPDYFNASNKNNKLDSRSDAKGPEAESVTVCQVGSKTYAYIGLERIGGVMLYDITDPTEPAFCDYINSRDFTVSFPGEGTDPAQGDVSVEGLCAVPAAQSPTGYPLLLAANEVSGTVAVYQQQEGYVDPNPGSGSGTSSGGKTETTTNPDGSITTTVTGADGSKTETTKAVDGSTSVVKTSKDGKVEAKVTLSSSALAATDEAVKLPMPELTAAGSTAEAPVITVDLPAGHTAAKVEIPVANVTAGTVAVLVRADGSEEIVKTSVSTEDGVVLTVQDGDTVKIIDNAKTFADVPATFWGADAVDFAVSRTLFNGVSSTEFAPNSAMTRAMIVTVLARMEGVDTADGAVWYEAGRQWAMEQGISDGSNLMASLTREQLAAMLYRYAGSPAVTGTLTGFADAQQVSSWAQDAMVWAVENGIMEGMNGKLNPQGEATRVQVATMLMRFCEGIQ